MGGWGSLALVAAQPGNRFVSFVRARAHARKINGGLAVAAPGFGHCSCWEVLVQFRFLLFAFCFWLLAFGFWLLAFGFWLLGLCLLLVACCLLLVAFCFLLFAFCFLFFAFCVLLLCVETNPPTSYHARVAL